MINVNEVFESRQGEGKYAGHMAVFVRLAGCTRNCSWCDTPYHIEGMPIHEKDLAKVINKFKSNIIVWTGGEPLLQMENIVKTMSFLKHKFMHLESNGDLIVKNKELLQSCQVHFDYMCFSPKEKYVAKFLYKFTHSIFSSIIDIKVVTDMKTVGMDMLKYATMLMPLSTYNEKKDLEIMKRVWNYNKTNVVFSARLHSIIFGKKRGV